MKTPSLSSLISRSALHGSGGEMTRLMLKQLDSQAKSIVIIGPLWFALPFRDGC